jgi:hypothetical protein
MNQKKTLINPFLFILAKRMLDYEFFGLNKPPKISELVECIYQRHLEKSKKGTKFTDPKGVHSPRARSIAERIRKYVLLVNDYLVSEEMLDHLLREITILLPPTTWKEFVKRFGREHFAIFGRVHVHIILQRQKGIKAKVLYADMLNSAHPMTNHFNLERMFFTEDDTSLYLAHVNVLLTRIHLDITIGDYKNDPWIGFKVFNPIVFVRSANELEVPLLENLTRIRHNLPYVPFHDDLIRQHKTHKDIYFHFLNRHGLPLGACVIIPLKHKEYLEYQKSWRRKQEISEDDLLFTNKRKDIKCVFLDILLKEMDDFDEVFTKGIRKLLNSYCEKIPETKIYIGAIPCSKYQKNLLKELQFTLMSITDRVNSDGSKIAFYQLVNDKDDDSPF